MTKVSPSLSFKSFRVKHQQLCQAHDEEVIAIAVSPDGKNVPIIKVTRKLCIITGK
jgi:hypothetical protein